MQFVSTNNFFQKIFKLSLNISRPTWRSFAAHQLWSAALDLPAPKQMHLSPGHSKYVTSSECNANSSEPCIGKIKLTLFMVTHARSYNETTNSQWITVM